MRQVAILDLVPDEKTERFLVHSGLAGSSGPRTHATFTGVSTPGKRQPARPRCRRRGG